MPGWQGESVVLDDQVMRLQLHLVVGAKPEVVVLALRRRIDPPPLVAAEWPLLVVVSDDVLADLRADGFEKVAEMSDHRERPENRMLSLRQVVDGNDDQENGHDGNDQHNSATVAYWRAGGSDRLVRVPPSSEVVRQSSLSNHAQNVLIGIVLDARCGPCPTPRITERKGCAAACLESVA